MDSTTRIKQIRVLLISRKLILPRYPPCSTSIIVSIAAALQRVTMTMPSTWQSRGTTSSSSTQLLCAQRGDGLQSCCLEAENTRESMRSQRFIALRQGKRFLLIVQRRRGYTRFGTLYSSSYPTWGGRGTHKGAEVTGSSSPLCVCVCPCPVYRARTMISPQSACGKCNPAVSTE